MVSPAVRTSNKKTHSGSVRCVNARLSRMLQMVETRVMNEESLSLGHYCPYWLP